MAQPKQKKYRNLLQIGPYDSFRAHLRANGTNLSDLTSLEKAAEYEVQYNGLQYCLKLKYTTCDIQGGPFDLRLLLV